MPKRWSRIFALILVVPLLLAVLAACGAGSTGAQEKVTIKIGSDYPTSGDDQSAGLPAQQGAELAVKEAIAQKFLDPDKYNLVFSPYDDVGPGGTHDGNKAQQNVNQMIGDAQVAGIVGPLNSSIAKVIMKSANEAPIALISPSNTNDCLTGNTPDYECGGANSILSQVRPTGKVTYFRLATLDQNQGGALAQYAYNQGYRKVFIIDDTETYGKGLADSFEYYWKNKLQGTTVVDRRSIAKQANYDNALAAVAAARPDFLFFGGNDSTGGKTIRLQMPSIAGLEKMPFYAGDGNKTSDFAKDVIPSGGGPVINSVPGLDPSAVGKKATDFIASFKKAFPGATIGAYSGGSYDAAWIVLNAIKVALDKGVQPPADAGDDAQAKTFRQAVIDAMKGITYTGVTGKHSFDANGDTTNKNISLYTLGKVGEGDGWKFVTSIMPK